MDLTTIKSKQPQSIGEFHFTNKEYCQYLYLPIKMAGSWQIILEPRLEFLTDMINRVCQHEYKTMCQDYDVWLSKYMYLTIKQTFIPKDTHHNRPGWHSDGFGTDDVQYIWFDTCPTEFMLGDFHVRNDDQLSMLDFDIFEKKINRQLMGLTHGMDGHFVQPDPFHLYRIDQSHIHRTTPATENGVRTFVKITVSDRIYAQEGNSHNYLIDYNWPLSTRELTRNQPHLSK